MRSSPQAAVFGLKMSLRESSRRLCSAKKLHLTAQEQVHSKIYRKMESFMVDDVLINKAAAELQGSELACDELVCSQWHSPTA
ncbi:DNA polymerase, beta domain protein region [Pseudomonas syringae pv. coriandricola]|nr:DNA polymerase, beta domain protein region [Pseudomonas syringae pv. coriandricola]